MGTKKIVMKALVTGGGGFLGSAIVRSLLGRGYKVRTFQRGDYPFLYELGVGVHRGDLADGAAVLNATEDCDVIFHVAAKAGVWGNYDEYYQSNVIGTQNVINACEKNQISRLIYTSSPSVVFDGSDEENINESVDYPEKYLTNYPRTKALAERMILKANQEKLATVALRPHLIWGPGDPHLVPRILKRAKAGRLRLVGIRDNLVDSTYIDNAVEAHLLAAENLSTGSACAGKAYFISNGEPIPMAELINRILAAAQLPPVTKRISPATAYLAGMFFESIYKLLHITKEPLMTRFVAQQLSSAHWFDISAARRDLGYQPKISINEGMQLLAKALA